MEKHVRTANLASLLSALILFLLPWTNVTCAGQRVATQTGLQASWGGVTPGAGVEQSQTTTVDFHTHDSDLAPSALIAIALAIVVAAAVIALLVAFHKPAPAMEPGLLAIGALVLLGLVAAIGFPLDDMINGELARRPPRDGGFEQAMGNAVRSSFVVERTPWFWLELVALAVPSALYLWRRFGQGPPIKPGSVGGAGSG
jgi:hypothetical protein